MVQRESAERKGAATASLIGYSSRKLKQDMDDRRIPLMGVLGAFIFAAQMINFTIPGTGSSGHLGGGCDGRLHLLVCFSLPGRPGRVHFPYHRQRSA